MIVATDRRNVSEDQDWRLEIELDVADKRSTLDRVMGRVRGPDIAEEARAAVSHEVVITHDGKLLFAYAATEDAILRARSAIEGVMGQDGVKGSTRVSHWDEDRDTWRQTDPPPTAEEQRLDEVAMRDGEVVQTRTMVVSAGKLISPTLEQSLLAWADKLGVQCTIVEHPHLLSTQIGITVTGPKHKLDEFARGLKAEEMSTIRAERSVMLSPL